jgi:iron complex transport system ATP-binding protein
MNNERTVRISATDVGVAIEASVILESVSIDVVAGEVLALVGPNGAGKSTLLGVLSGDRRPTSGTVLYDGTPVRSLRHLELARLRAVLTQENAVSFPFRVREVVEMGRSPWGRTPALQDDETEIAHALEATDVTHLADRRFTSLSGGEKARVSLARVLAQHTGIVFLDEPTAALDLRHQEDVMRTARVLARQGRAVVVVLHDLSLAGAYADRIALLSGGRLVTVGTPDEVLTAELVRSAYGLDVQILRQPETGRPIVLPLRAAHDA